MTKTTRTSGNHVAAEGLNPWPWPWHPAPATYSRPTDRLPPARLTAAREKGRMLELMTTVPDAFTEEEYASVIERFRWWWPNSALPTCIAFFNCLVSLLTVVIYCTNTYYGHDATLAIIYVAASISFLVEYVLSMLAAKSWLRYVLFSTFIIDLMAIAYGLINFGFYYGGVEITSFWRLLRIIEALRLFKAISHLVEGWLLRNNKPTEVELFKVSFNLAMTIFGVVFIAACIFFELNDEQASGGQMYLHQSFYWASVTISTIGYGEFFPNTPVTQMLLPVMLIFILLLLPWRVSELTTVLESINFYMRRSYKSVQFGQHVVVGGNFNTVSAKAFVDEFFHPDRGYQDKDVLLLNPKYITADLMCMLSAHKANSHLMYLQGSCFSAFDLDRADATKAECIFFLCDKYAEDEVAEDQNTLMRVLAAAQYIRQNTGLDVVFSWISASWTERMQTRVSSQSHAIKMPHIIAQFHLPEYVERAKALLNRQAIHPPEFGMLPVEKNLLFPICIGAIKYSLIASSIQNPGLSTLIANLSTSVRLTRNDMFGREVDMVKGLGWLEEYLHGAENEMYELPGFPPSYEGITFKQAAALIYKKYGAVLLGIGHSKLDEHSRRLAFGVQLAPTFLVIAPGMTGYILAKEKLALEDDLKSSLHGGVERFPEGLPRLGSASLPVASASYGSANSKGKVLKAVSHTANLLTVQAKEEVPLWELFKDGFESKEEFKVELKDTLKGVEGLVVKDPFIITGSSCFNHLHFLVAAIRAGKLGDDSGNPIIIMDPEGPSAEQAAVLVNHPGVHLLKGQPKQLMDMHKLGVEPGSKISAIVLPSSKGLGLPENDESSGKRPCVADAESIQVCSNLLQYGLYNNCRVSLATEVVAPLNAPYLLSLCSSIPPSAPPAGNLSALVATAPAEAAPSKIRVFMQHFCTVAWRPVSDFLKRRLGMSFLRSTEKRREAFLRQLMSQMPFLSPALSSGHVMSSSFLDNLLCNSFFNPMLLQIISSLIGAKDDATLQRGVTGEKTHPRVHSVPIQALLAHHQCGRVAEQMVFEDLFTFCLALDKLPIGLYRQDPGRDPEVQAPSSTPSFQYVMTNPEASCKLRSSDSVFVICTADSLP